MEGHRQVKVRVGVHVALCWRDCEVLREVGGVPLEIGLNVTEVAHLQALGETAILDNLAKGDDFIHDLELDAMSDTTEGEKLLGLFDTLDLDHNVLLEVRETHFRLELDFNWEGLLGPERMHFWRDMLVFTVLSFGHNSTVVRAHSQECLVEGLLALCRDSELDTLGAAVNNGNTAACMTSN